MSAHLILLYEKRSEDEPGEGTKSEIVVNACGDLTYAQWKDAFTRILLAIGHTEEEASKVFAIDLKHFG